MPSPLLALPLNENDPSRHVPHVFDKHTLDELISQLRNMEAKATEALRKSLPNNEKRLFGEIEENAVHFAKALSSISAHGELVVQADALTERWKGRGRYPELLEDPTSIWNDRWSKKPFPFYLTLFMGLHGKIADVLDNFKPNVFEGSWEALVSILSMIVWVVLRVLNENEGVLLDYDQWETHFKSATNHVFKDTGKEIKRQLEGTPERASIAVQNMSNRHIQIVQRQLNEAFDRLHAIACELERGGEAPLSLYGLINALPAVFPSSDETSAITLLQHTQAQMVETQRNVLGLATNFVYEWCLLDNASDTTTLSVFSKSIVPILRNVCAVQLLPGHESVVAAFDEAVERMRTRLDESERSLPFPGPSRGDRPSFSGRRCDGILMLRP